MTLHQYIKDLYAQINRSRETLGEILRTADRVQEIAMSASVNASHAGNSSRVLTEIANQIHQTGTRVASLSLVAQREIGGATNLILHAVKSHDNLEKYNQSARGIKGEENQTLLSNAIVKLEMTITNKLSEILGKISACEAVAETILQLQNRLFGIVNAMKIESISLGGDIHSTVLHLSDSLESLQNKSVSDLEQLLFLLTSIRGQARSWIHREEVAA